MIPAIQIKNLHKSYEDTIALRGINLTIRPGEFYGLLGPNGAGKTTTIGLITGLVRMEKGSISVFGKDIIRDYRFTRSKIGLSPQEFTS
ncbi:MAG: ATP-binding cassette domain-containing protein, partial [Candidatus Marinimicrobia bacterium]|nr:ATP-binding cassette domain-containing protein [Candidatus Neomarinimicrobiota bacterium]MDP6593918.1 ATP-binding cassette domain-containing protein [Candidatus Neomarinimicrobiota bacterium]